VLHKLASAKMFVLRFEFSEKKAKKDCLAPKLQMTAIEGNTAEIYAKLIFCYEIAELVFVVCAVF